MTGRVLACVSIALVAAFLFVFQRSIVRVEVGEKRAISNALIWSATLSGIVALTQSPGLLGGILAGLSVVTGALFIGLYTLKGQSKQTPAVAVGERLLEFSALDEEAKPFELASLKGRPILLKFFRGHW